MNHDLQLHLVLLRWLRHVARLRQFRYGYQIVAEERQTEVTWETWAYGVEGKMIFKYDSVDGIDLAQNMINVMLL